VEAILGKYDAEITQTNAQWHITASDCKQSERMLYTFEGVYDDTQAAPAVLTLGKRATGDVYPVGSLSRTLEPGAKKVTLSHDYGRKGSLLDNYDFSQFDGSNFTSWEKVGSGFTLSQRIYEGKPCCFIAGFASIQPLRIAQQIPIENVPDEAFVFELDFAPIGNSQSAGGFFPVSMAVRFTVILDVGNTSWYLTKTGWSTTSAYIEEIVTAGMVSPVWNHIKIITDELPGSGYLDVSLYRYYLGTPARPGDTFSGIWYSQPLVYFMNNGQLYPSGVKMTATFDNSTEPGDLGEIDVMIADAPDLPNKSLLYFNITRLDDGSPTLNWIRLGESVQYSLIAQLARLLASRSRVARQKLSGTIRGSSINPNSIITHPYNGNRNFEIAEMSWDLYEEKFDVTLIELLDWSSEAITFTVENTNAGGGSSTTGGTIIGTIGGNDAGQGASSLAFQTPAFANPLDLDATLYKNFKPGIATGNSVINVLNASDGDVGMIELIIDGTGGYTITMGNMFTKRIGSAEIDTAAGADNFIVWRKILDDYVYEVLGGIDLSSEAVLALDSISAGPITANSSGEFGVDYTIVNSGAGAGTGVVDWQITLDGDVVSSGSFRSTMVDPVTPLEGTLTLIAPSVVDDYVIWMKMRTDDTFTFNIALTVQSSVEITSIDTIPDVANGQIFRVLYYLNNIAEASLMRTINWRVLDVVGGMLTSGSIYQLIEPGEHYTAIDILIPSVAQSGLILELSITGESLEAVSSNEFAAIAVTLNHIDTIGNVSIGDFFTYYYEVTSAAACRLDFQALVRTNTHEQMLVVQGGIMLSAGTNTLSQNIDIPNESSYIMTDADVLMRKWGGANQIISNHFNITG
jgi:hypothetical protein